jgi:hypothetical protein
MLSCSALFIFYGTKRVIPRVESKSLHRSTGSLTFCASLGATVSGGVPGPSAGGGCTTLLVGLFPSSPCRRLLGCRLGFLCFSISSVVAAVPVLPSVVAVEAFCSSASASVLGLVGVFLWCLDGSFCFVMGDLMPLLDCYLHSHRWQLRVVASPVFTDAAAADARSTFEVCRGVSMVLILAVFPMLGAACQSWQVEFVLASSSGVSSGLRVGRVIWWCLKSLVGCVMHFQ